MNGVALLLGVVLFYTMRDYGGYTYNYNYKRKRLLSENLAAASTTEDEEGGDVNAVGGYGTLKQ